MPQATQTKYRHPKHTVAVKPTRYVKRRNIFPRLGGLSGWVAMQVESLLTGGRWVRARYMAFTRRKAADPEKEDILTWFIHFSEKSVPPGILRYIVALAVVGCVALMLHAALAYTSLYNTSLAYLIVVLWVAVSFGRGPAFVATAVACIIHYRFFTPSSEIARLTAWLPFFIMFIIVWTTSSVLAETRLHRQKAREQERRAVRVNDRANQLYSVTMLASRQLSYNSFAQNTLDFEEHARRTLDEFASSIVRAFIHRGLEACSVNFPDASNRLVQWVIRNPSDRTLLDLADKSQCVDANHVWEKGTSIGNSLSPNLPTNWNHTLPAGVAPKYYYLPLRKGDAVVGVLGIAGSSLIETLVYVPKEEDEEELKLDQQLFQAFQAQLALVIELLKLSSRFVPAGGRTKMATFLGQRANMVTHELLNPIAKSIGEARRLREGVLRFSQSYKLASISAREETTKLVTVSTSIEENMRQIKASTEKLLYLSRLNQEAFKLDLRQVAISDLIEEALTDLEPLITQSGCHIDKGEPVEIEVRVDAQQMTSVLNNLFENAVKYTVGPKKMLRVRVYSYTPSYIPASHTAMGKFCEIHINDNGIGIPPHELNNIFEPYHRVPDQYKPSALKQVSGFGLGLAICRLIVENHGGNIRVESTMDKGSTFIISLPISVEEPAMVRDVATTKHAGDGLKGSLPVR